MDEKKIHIDDLYRAELGNHTEVPDNAVWESLTNRLDNQPQPAAIATPYKWLWRMAAALLLAGAVLLIAKKLLNNNTTTNSLITNSTVAENTIQPVSKSAIASQPKSTENNTTASEPLDASTMNGESNTTAVPTTTSTPQQVAPANTKELTADKHNSKTASNINKAQNKTATNNNPVLAGNRNAGNHTITSKTKGYAGYAINETVANNKPKHNKNTAPQNNTYVAPPVYTYTAPVVTTPPAHRWHAPRFDPNSTGPQAQASVPLSYTQQALQAAAPVVVATAPVPSTVSSTYNNIPAPAAITNPDDNIRKALPFSFNYGAKLGYEFANGEYHVNSYVFSPYIQFNLTNKLSLVLQPGIKSSTINKTYLDAGQSYYNITSAQLDSNHQKIQTSIDTADSPVYGAIKPKYYYTQTHDSIVTSTAIAKKTYFEFELPVLVQYEVVKHLRVYGGISANFSKIVEVKEQREEYKNITLKDSVILKPQAAANPAPPVPSPYNKFAYSYLPYSQYNATSEQNPANSPVRFGYMLGFNYQAWRKFSIDILMQGTLSNPAYIYDTRVRNLYQQTHFRISLGYQFGK